MKRYWPLMVAAILLLAGAATMPADKETKDLIVRLQGDVLVMQRQMRDLQESFDKANAVNSSLLQKNAENADAALRSINGVEESLRTAQTAQNNNLTGATAKLNRITDQLAQSDQRFTQLSTQLNSLRTLLERQQQELKQEFKQEMKRRADEQSNAQPTFNSPEQLYSQAYSLYTQGKYDQAISYFRTYLGSYASTEAADNALYFIGEAYFSQTKYTEALREYEQVIASYPNGDRVQAAYLKKGLCLLYLERRDDGVAALKSLASYYPGSPEAATARQELARLGETLPAPATAGGTLSTGSPAASKKRPRAGKPR